MISHYARQPTSVTGGKLGTGDGKRNTNLMTKQNRIHKLVVIREKGRKDVRRFLSSMPNVYSDEKSFIDVKRERTYIKPFYKRFRKRTYGKTFYRR